MRTGKTGGIAFALVALTGVTRVEAAEPDAAAAQSQGQEKTAPAQPAPRLPLKVFAQLERTKSAEISPDGKHFVSISNREGRYCVTIHPLPPDSGKTILYPPYDPKFEYLWASWASDSRVLAGEIATLDRGRQGMYTWSTTNETRMLSMAADGSSIINAIKPLREASTGTMIKHEAANLTAPIQDDVINWLPNEANHVLVSIQDNPARDRFGASVRKIDVTTGEYTYLKGPERGVWGWQTDQAGQVRLGWGTLLDGGTVNRFLMYKNPATDKWQEVDDSPLMTDAYTWVGFDSDPRYALVLGAGPQNRRALLRFDLAADRVADPVYADPESEVESVLYAPDRSGRIIGVALQNGSSVYLEGEWKRWMASLHAALPGMRMRVTSATRDQTQFVVEAYSGTEPGVYYLFEPGKHRLSAIEYARADLEPSQMAPVQMIKYQANDGLTIHAVLTLPRGLAATNLPAVLLPHGGPVAHDTGKFDWLAQFLANRGYAVLQPNFRGSTGYGIAFQRAGDRQWGRGMQDDLTDGAHWLVQKGIADPKRIAIVGASYGGYAALMGAVKTPDLFRCAVSVAGISDVVALLTSDTGGFKDEEVAHRVGDPSSDRDMLDAVSPLRHVDQIKVPVLLVHAKDDLRVDISQSERMYDALRKAGKPAEFVTLETGHHWLLNEAARTKLLSALEAFREKNLQRQAD